MSGFPRPRERYVTTLADRLVALLAATLFAVPSAFLLWFGLNLELAPLGVFLESPWLWGTIAAFAVVSLFSPDLFVDLLGALWHAMYRLARWLH